MGKADTSQLDGNPFENGASLKKKPWLTPQEQVEHLRNQGVRFDLMSENDATSYLAKNNNFFRLRSYRQGFAKVEEGKRKGQFANLDFKMLVDLSIIDMLLRYEMLRLTLDIEHFSKVMLLAHIEGHREDGYQLVQDFVASYDHSKGGKTVNRLKQEREKQSLHKRPYCRFSRLLLPRLGFPRGYLLRQLQLFHEILRRAL